ncbi:MAG: hypothetical protein QM305_08345 [Bacteroidota bacterium]|nr:hypothetical protein [Bacteroidota bacterium]
MTLQEFIQDYDKEGAVVLLEGTRQVLAKDKNKRFGLHGWINN